MSATLRRWRQHKGWLYPDLGLLLWKKPPNDKKGKKKTQEPYAKEVGVGNPSEERTNS